MTPKNDPQRPPVVRSSSVSRAGVGGGMTLDEIAAVLAEHEGLHVCSSGIYSQMKKGRPCDAHRLAQEAQRLAGKVARVEALPPEWERSAAEDEAWLNGPRVSVSEAHELPSAIGLNRGRAAEVRAALADPEQVQP